jgi:hypothetical protein
MSSCDFIVPEQHLTTARTQIKDEHTPQPTGKCGRRRAHLSEYLENVIDKLPEVIPIAGDWHSRDRALWEGARDSAYGTDFQEERAMLAACAVNEASMFRMFQRAILMITAATI